MTVLRFWTADPPPDAAVALTLDGLPAPAWVAVGGEGDGEGEADLELEVEALVVRGTPGGRFVMMSYGRRNPSLSRPEFAERWKEEAGNLGGEVIPDEVRGLAYVQYHPIDEDPPLDAVNQVWFDDLESLRRRAEWFAARPIPETLMDPSTCGALYLRHS
jgi:hypothetical protein